jgi:hypothetical protein
MCSTGEFLEGSSSYSYYSGMLTKIIFTATEKLLLPPQVSDRAHHQFLTCLEVLDSVCACTCMHSGCFGGHLTWLSLNCTAYLTYPQTFSSV